MILRVLTYNVLSLRRGVDRVAAVIAQCDPDVVCVQEAPRFLSGRRRCRDLADRAGLRLVTGGRAAGANLLLARPGLVVGDAYSVRLPWHPPRHRRGLAVGSFLVDGVEVVVAATHLSLDAAERLDQARRAIAVLARHPERPAILAGDVNEDPPDAAWTVLATVFADAYATAPDGDGLTSTAEDPRRRIDGVFVDRRLRVVSCGVPAVAGLREASDHLPVLARIDPGTVG